jgi:hypothetical protein
VALDFGPWAGAGMVTAELQREYAKRGIPLIPLEDGVRATLDVLFTGPATSLEVPQLILTAGPADLFDGASAAPGGEPLSTSAATHALPA